MGDVYLVIHGALSYEREKTCMHCVKVLAMRGTCEGGVMSAWLSIVHCHMSVKSSECLMCQSVVWVTFSHPSVSDPPSPWKMLRVDKMKRKKTAMKMI